MQDSCQYSTLNENHSHLDTLAGARVPEQKQRVKCFFQLFLLTGSRDYASKSTLDCKNLSVYNFSMITKIHVYDLDGVLVDTAHRYRNKSDGSIDLDYWLNNRHRIGDDSLLPLADQFIDDCNSAEIYTILCTARVKHIDDVTFIRNRLAYPNKLLMRPIGNNEPDATLKYRQLRKLFNLRQFAKLPRVLFEDNCRNIAALQNVFDSCILIESHITEGTK
jgi:hypothetical protein